MKPRDVVFSGLVFLLLLSASAFGALRASPPIGAIVQTWWFDSVSKELVVRLLNTSQKGITAFNLAVTERFPDGTTQYSDHSTDYLPRMASVQLFPDLRDRFGDGTFPAGTSRDIRLPIQKELSDASIVVDVVLYTDQTAEGSNKEMLGQLLAMRQGDILAMQQTNAVIAKALASPNARESARTELKRLADVAHARLSRSDDPSTHTEGALRQLLGKVEEADDLSSIVKENETRIAFYSAHSRLRAVQP